MRVHRTFAIQSFVSLKTKYATIAVLHRLVGILVHRILKIKDEVRIRSGHNVLHGKASYINSDVEAVSLNFKQNYLQLDEQQ
jgi:acetyltransferase-like isoleucine patch superfamily enzyme